MIQTKFYTKKIEKGSNEAEFIIEPLPQSFGFSMGNALRRTLLSSLNSAALTQVKIKNAPHLFTTIAGVKESVLEIVMNLKNLRFIHQGSGPFSIKIESRKQGKIYGKDVYGDLEVVNKDLYIAEITDSKGGLEIEGLVEVGSGFLPAKDQMKKEVGYIPLDTFFSPVKKVSFRVEEARVGRKTNLDRLIINILTDGSLSPDSALRQASLLLSDFFSYLLSGKDRPQIETDEEKIKKEKETIDSKYNEIIIDELNLPSRIVNALLREKIETVADLIKVGKEKLSTMKGVGKKSIELINEELTKMGIEI